MKEFNKLVEELRRLKEVIDGSKEKPGFEFTRHSSGALTEGIKIAKLTDDGAVKIEVSSDTDDGLVEPAVANALRDLFNKKGYASWRKYISQAGGHQVINIKVELTGQKQFGTNESKEEPKAGKVYKVVKTMKVPYFRDDYPENLETYDIDELMEMADAIERLIPGKEESVQYLAVTNIAGDYVLAAANLADDERFQPSSKHLYVIPVNLFRDSVQMVLESKKGPRGGVL